jgi:hypothetical protein
MRYPAVNEWLNNARDASLPRPETHARAASSHRIAEHRREIVRNDKGDLPGKLSLPKTPYLLRPLRLPPFFD